MEKIKKRLYFHKYNPKIHNYYESKIQTDLKKNIFIRLGWDWWI